MAGRWFGIHHATMFVFFLLAIVLIALNFVHLGEEHSVGFPIRTALRDNKEAPFDAAYYFICFNGPVCLLLIILTPILTEWFIRRKERRKQEGGK
jgi:hypothetical protein